MTFFVAVVDFEAGKLTYSSAAHNPPWLYRKGKDGRYAAQSLTAEGLRLGETRDAAQLARYQALFPVFWESEHVDGVTLWGYVRGAHWRTNQGDWLMYGEANAAIQNQPPTMPIASGTSSAAI